MLLQKKINLSTISLQRGEGSEMRILFFLLFCLFSSSTGHTHVNHYFQNNNLVADDIKKKGASVYTGVIWNDSAQKCNSLKIWILNGEVVWSLALPQLLNRAFCLLDNRTDRYINAIVFPPENVCNRVYRRSLPGEQYYVVLPAENEDKCR